jgi:hypothetical protein
MWLYDYIGAIFLSMGIIVVGLLAIFYVRIILSQKDESQNVHMNFDHGLRITEH